MSSAIILPNIVLEGLWPIILLSIAASLALLVSAFGGRKADLPATGVALVGLATASIAAFTVGDGKLNSFQSTLLSGPFNAPLIALFCSAAFLTLLLSVRDRMKADALQGETAAILLFSVCGMILMVQATDLIVLFLGVELMSIPLYCLAALRKRSKLSNEGAIKYFLLGAFSSALLLYGIAILYGTTGTTSYDSLLGFSGQRANYRLYFVANMLVFSGFFFKASLVPFHMWAPDAYQGAPAPITGFMSTAVKAAAMIALAVFIRTLQDPYWNFPMALIIIGTVIFGNLLALKQTDLKRMLAYSSIAHAGYLALPLMGNLQEPDNLALMMFYLFGYTFLNIGAFAIIGFCAENEDGAAPQERLKGLYQRRPMAALALSIFMFGLAGIPPLAGFTGKLFLFNAGMRVFTWPLLAAAAIGSAIGVYYYLRVVVTCYMEPPDEEGETTGERSLAVGLVVTICLAMTLLLGIYPTPLVAVLQNAARFFSF